MSVLDVNRAPQALRTDVPTVGRYLAVSAFNFVNHQVLLQIALRWFDWSGGVANVFAAMVSAGPAYLLSRYWVWQVRGRDGMRTEIVSFWAIAAVGLVVSTVLAELADRWFDDHLMVSVAVVVGYGTVWVAKFVILNVLFSRPRTPPRSAPR